MARVRGTRSVFRSRGSEMHGPGWYPPAEESGDSPDHTARGRRLPRKAGVGSCRAPHSRRMPSGAPGATGPALAPQRPPPGKGQRRRVGAGRRAGVLCLRPAKGNRQGWTRVGGPLACRTRHPDTQWPQVSRELQVFSPERAPRVGNGPAGKGLPQTVPLPSPHSLSPSWGHSGHRAVPGGGPRAGASRAGRGTSAL